MPNKTIECPSCKTVNDAKNKFCKNCGTSLKIDKIKCPKCGNLNDSDSAFCSECGASLKEEKKATASAPSAPSNVFKTANVQSSVRLIAVGLMFIAIILAFIGIFGNVVTSTINQSGSTVSTTTNSLSYFFKDCWDQLKTIKQIMTENKTMGAYAQYVIETIFHFISFLVVFIGIICLVAYFSYRAYKAISTKEKFSLPKFFKILVCVAAPYVLLTAFFALASEKSYSTQDPRAAISAANTFGWGVILLIVSLFIAFASYFIDEILSRSKEKRATFCLTGLATLLMLFSLIFGFSGTIHVSSNNSQYVSTSTSVSVFEFFADALTFLRREYDYSELYITSGTITLFVFSIILIFASMICVVLNIVTKGNKKRIALSVLMVVLSIVSGILTSNAVLSFYKDLGYTTNAPNIDALAPAFIVNIVFGVLSSAGSIVALASENKK